MRLEDLSDIFESANAMLDEASHYLTLLKMYGTEEQQDAIEELLEQISYYFEEIDDTQLRF
jgi:hypothetical protein